MDGVYIHAKCKCGRTIRGLKEYLKKGISCPDCGEFVKARITESEQPQKNITSEIKQITENDSSGGSKLTDKCPFCSTVVNIDYKKKYLACCSACNKMFIRSLKPEPEDLSDDESSSVDNAPDNTKKHSINEDKQSSSGAMPGPDESIIIYETETVDPNAGAAQSETTSETKKKKVPPDKQSFNAAKPDAPPVPPSEKQLKLLRHLSIGGRTENGNELSDIIITITSLVENAIREYNMSFHLFPIDIKTEITYNVIKSPYFPGIYFGDRDIKHEELQPIIDEAIRDVELRKAMKTYIPDECFTMAEKYISGFCEYVYNAPIDPDTLKVLALKSFVRGFGPRLQPFSNVLYDNRAGTKNISEQEKHNYRLFFKKKTSTNAYLETLLNEYGFKKPVKEPESMFGCMIYFTPVLLPILIYLAS